MRLLVLTPYLSAPPEHGGRIRSFHLMRELARHHEVVNVSGRASDDAPEAEALLEREGVRVVSSPLEPRFGKLVGRDRWRKVQALLRGRSSLVARFRSAALAAAVAREAAGAEAVLLEHVWMGAYAAAIGALPLVLLTQNVESLVLRRKAETLANPGERTLARLEAALVEREERRLLRRATLAVAASEEDAAALSRLAPSVPTAAIPNGVDLAARPILPPPRWNPLRLLYLGSYGYDPNVGAARRLALEILPVVRSRWPDAEAWIAGRDPAGALRGLEGSPGVRVLGHVDDLAATFDQASALVVPLRYGGGSRLKILDSWAFGRPVVSSAAGAEGLGAEDGRHLLLAEEPGAFADALGRLRSGPGLAASLIVHARARVEERHAWPALAARYREAIEKAVRSPADSISTCKSRSSAP